MVCILPTRFCTFAECPAVRSMRDATFHRLILLPHPRPLSAISGYDHLPLTASVKPVQLVGQSRSPGHCTTPSHPSPFRASLPQHLGALYHALISGWRLMLLLGSPPHQLTHHHRDEHLMGSIVHSDSMQRWEEDLVVNALSSKADGK